MVQELCATSTQLASSKIHGDQISGGSTFKRTSLGGARPCFTHYILIVTTMSYKGIRLSGEVLRLSARPPRRPAAHARPTAWTLVNIKAPGSVSQSKGAFHTLCSLSHVTQARRGTITLLSGQECRLREARPLVTWRGRAISSARYGVEQTVTHKTRRHQTPCATNDDRIRAASTPHAARAQVLGRVRS